MRWPEGLAEQVDAAAGERGRSGFVVAALNGERVLPVADKPKPQAVAGAAPSRG
jgi:hypothetical protein